MSEVREVLERTFSTEGNAHAITLAALWLSTHDDVEVDSIVGDADYVMVYYTQQEQIAKGSVADATEYMTIPRFTLRSIGVDPNYAARSAG